MIFDRQVQVRKQAFLGQRVTVGRNKKAMKAYVQNQLQEDQMADQVSIKKFVDLFTGSKNTKA